MKRVILKSVLSVALCSIVAMLTTSCSKEFVQENQFKSMDLLAYEDLLPRWQEQLKWIDDTFEIVFPELDLIGWRKVGILNSQDAINEFIDDGLQDNKMFGHTVNLEKRIYEVAPRSELTHKYGVWGDEAIQILKKQFKDKCPIGAEIIELKWLYNGKEYFEKIAVTNNIDDLGNSIMFSTVSQFITTENVPLANWQIEHLKQRELESKTMTPKKQKLIAAQLEKLNKESITRIGIDGEEEPRNLQQIPKTHYFMHPQRENGASICDVEVVFFAQFEMNTLTFDSWDVVIVKHNAAYGFQSDVDAVLTYGIAGVSAVAKYIWGYTWDFVGYNVTDRIVDVSRGNGYLNFSHITNQFVSDELTIFCPVPAP